MDSKLNERITKAMKDIKIAIFGGFRGLTFYPIISATPGFSVCAICDARPETRADVKKKVGDEKIEVNVINGNNPSVISDTRCEAYDRVRSTVTETWPDVIVSPYLMVACSDSRHWGEISDKVYRFSPMTMSSEERASIHGNNEKIPVATISKTVEFFIRLMKKS